MAHELREKLLKAGQWHAGEVTHLARTDQERAEDAGRLIDARRKISALSDALELSETQRSLSYWAAGIMLIVAISALVIASDMRRQAREYDRQAQQRCGVIAR